MASKVFGLTSTGPGMCNFTCAIKRAEAFTGSLRRQGTALGQLRAAPDRATLRGAVGVWSFPCVIRRDAHGSAEPRPSGSRFPLTAFLSALSSQLSALSFAPGRATLRGAVRVWSFPRVIRRDAHGSAEPRPTGSRFPLTAFLSALSFAPGRATLRGAVRVWSLPRVIRRDAYGSAEPRPTGEPLPAYRFPLSSQPSASPRSTGFRLKSRANPQNSTVTKSSLRGARHHGTKGPGRTSSNLTPSHEKNRSHH